MFHTLILVRLKITRSEEIVWVQKDTETSLWRNARGKWEKTFLFSELFLLGALGFACPVSNWYIWKVFSPVTSFLWSKVLHAPLFVLVSLLSSWQMISNWVYNCCRSHVSVLVPLTLSEIMLISVSHAQKDSLFFFYHCVLLKNHTIPTTPTEWKHLPGLWTACLKTSLPHHWE